MIARVRVDRDQNPTTWLEGHLVWAAPEPGQKLQTVVGTVVATGFDDEGSWADLELTPEASGLQDDNPFG